MDSSSSAAPMDLSTSTSDPAVASSSSVPPPSSLDSLSQPSSAPSNTPFYVPPVTYVPLPPLTSSSPSLTVDSATGRVQGSIEKPFVYGSAAFWLGKQAAENQHSHRWTVFLRGLENEDLSYFIRSVTFGLHTSFPDHNRVITCPPFEVHETGWGEFSISITIHFLDEEISPVVLNHQLKLFPPPGTQPSTKKPVMSEIYDEFVFHSPLEQFYQQLVSGPKRRFDNHFLNQFWTTKEFAKEETGQIVKLTAAHGNIKARIERERQKLFLLDQEINQLTSKIH
jgi:YEATS domain-containing protein 4